jgi:gluconate 5-dehydrogenase
MAEDLKPYGITVNRLLPGGATATGMIPDDKEIRAEISAHMKLLPPSIMAKLVIFLCSDEAYGITGERIVVTDFDVWLNARSNSPASFEKKYRVTPWCHAVFDVMECSI